MANEKHVHGHDCDCGCGHDHHDHEHDHEHHEPEEYLHVVQRFAGKFQGGKYDGQTVAVVALDGEPTLAPFHQASWEGCDQIVYGKDSEYEAILPDDLADWFQEVNCDYALYTGMEPLRQGMLVASMARVAISGYKGIFVETNGIPAVDPIAQMRQTMQVMVAFGAASANGVAFITPVMDFYFEGNDAAERNCATNLNVLHAEDILRFIVTSESDMAALVNVVKSKNLSGRCQLRFVVQGDAVEPSAVQAYLADNGLAEVEYLAPMAIARA